MPMPTLLVENLLFHQQLLTYNEQIIKQSALIFLRQLDECIKNWAESHFPEQILFTALPWTLSPLCFRFSHTHTHTLKMCWCLLPWGCVYMLRPVHLVLNPQRVPHCRLPGPEDTRTGREPLETHRNSWVWSSILDQRHFVIPQRAPTD